MNNIGIYLSSRLEGQVVKSNFFVEGLHGNFLIGDGTTVDAQGQDFIKAHGGISKVINPLDSQPSIMKNLFSKYGCSEVRVDEFTHHDYPTLKLEQEFMHPQIRVLQTKNLTHILLNQRDREVLFLDGKILMRHHQLVGNIDKIELEQSLLKVIEEVDYCACFFADAGGCFFPVLPGLLHKKVTQLIALK